MRNAKSLYQTGTIFPVPAADAATPATEVLYQTGAIFPIPATVQAPDTVLADAAADLLTLRLLRAHEGILLRRLAQLSPSDPEFARRWAERESCQRAMARVRSLV